MNKILFIFLILNFACANPDQMLSHPLQNDIDSSISKETLLTTENCYAYPDFNLRELKPPFYLSEKTSNNSELEAPLAVILCFKKKLKTLYESNGGDTTETFFSLKELYVNSYFIKIDAENELYLLLLKNPTSFLMLETIGYNRSSKKVFANSIKTDLTWTYDLVNHQPMRSDWLNEYALNDPIIEFIDINNDGKKEIKINRIAHNGTAFTTLDEQYYQIADTTFISLFSYSKKEYLSIDDATISRKLSLSEINNTINLKVSISDNGQNTTVGTIRYESLNATSKYLQKEIIVDEKLTPEQSENWKKLLKSSFSHELN